MVALTCVKPQSVNIQDLYSPPAVIDNALALKRSGYRADTGALDAEEVSEKFVRQLDVAIAGAFAHDGQPAAHSRLDGMEMVADSRLSKLPYLDVAVTKHCLVENTAPLE